MKTKMPTKPCRVTSPRHQFAEKQEAERKAKEEEEERQRREAEAAEEALRNKPKSKTEQVNDLLRDKLAERLDLCGELLVLLRRAQDKASFCRSRQQLTKRNQICTKKYSKYSDSRGASYTVNRPFLSILKLNNRQRRDCPPPGGGIAS